MAARRGTSFSLKDLSAGEKLVAKIANIPKKADKELQKKMVAAVGMVYTIAHQKRPYITQKQAKLEGRRLLTKGKHVGKYHVVSDPSASAGVPVAYVNGGPLQSAITKKVENKGGIIRGTVSVSKEYAQYLEFGTPKMAARPFMRPAMMLTREALRALFKKKLFSK